MIETYLPVLILLGVAAAFPLGLLFVTSILGPKVEVSAKSDPYECGVPSAGNTHQKFPVKFYRVAILFLLFDVEAALLWPWAVLFKKQAGEWGAPLLFFELGLFLLILIVGYVYAWRKGALEWD